MAEAIHEVRNSLIDATRLYGLDDEGLTWQDGDRQQQRRYADVATVHLISYPSYGAQHLQCTLTDRAGKKTQIRSHHYLSPGRFDDRSQSYGVFIRELIARLGSQGHAVRFHCGSKIMRAVWMTLLCASVLILIGYVLAVLGGGKFSAGSIPPFVVLAVFLPICWSMIQRSKAKIFDPKAPPPEFLGNS